MAESPPPTTAMSWSAEEEAVAGGAGRHAVADQLGSRRRGPSISDWAPVETMTSGPGRWARRRRGRRPRPRTGRAERSTLVTFSVRISAPKRSACSRKSTISSGPMIAVGEAGEVLDLGGEHELAAGLVGGGGRLALDDQRGEVGPGGVDGGGEAGGAGPDDDDVADAGRWPVGFRGVGRSAHGSAARSRMRRWRGLVVGIARSAAAVFPGSGRWAPVGLRRLRTTPASTQHDPDDGVGRPCVGLAEDRTRAGRRRATRTAPMTKMIRATVPSEMANAANTA